MKLKFKKQQYQDDAINSLIRCFEGQPKQGSRRNLIDRIRRIKNKDTLFEQEVDEEIVAFSNQKILLSSDDIRRNINKIQRENGIKESGDKAGILNYSIEMETGTGKTYTYIKTMYELNAKYGWSKFIVIVPSIAIREGVLKSFQITENHFQETYHKKIRYFVYDSKNSSNIANINNFASDDSIQVMIINYQAFNTRSKDNRKIYEELDEIQSRKPIDVLKATRPILIIDEPQKFNKAEKVLDEFNPLLILRYSATHKKDAIYNMVYRLDAVDAYNQKLVKKINVKGIEIINNIAESAYIYLESVNISNEAPTAKLEIEKAGANGVRRIKKIFKQGDDLYTHSKNLEKYKGYVISEIDASNSEYDVVRFTNGVEIRTGQIVGDNSFNQVARVQIRETIKEHFEKEKELHKLGIKVLSLFFIDEVAKYKYYDNNVAYNGEYAEIFEEEYAKLFSDYYNVLDEEYVNYLDSIKDNKVHAGYFSIDKKASKSIGENVFIDSKVSRNESITDDVDAYDLIMRDKERLLSFEEPVRFIFSHSALREGWDNPNIFQICTLKNGQSEISKRQEIGRGLRICVDNNGDRMDYQTLEEKFHDINNLTVIASESYEEFSRKLQNEISETLTSRINKFDKKLFENLILTNENGEKYKFDENKYTKMLFEMTNNKYANPNKEFEVTENLVNDIKNNELKVSQELEPFKEDLTNYLRKYFVENKVEIGNKNKNNIKVKLTDNFYKTEFQELWNKINVKTTYEVNFDSEELIEKAVLAINNKLTIARRLIRIGNAEQNAHITAEEVKAGIAMKTLNENTEKYEYIDANITTKYDLIGEISSRTELTRKTIIRILKKISPATFSLYKYNPDEFIIKVSKLINEEKATKVIDGIVYNKIDQKYNNEIFTENNLSVKSNIEALEVKKNIYNYLVTDSEIERKFAKTLEQGEVTVYAKLPNGFKIPTPVGNYNPDWAIVFNNPEFKYIYFVAETKGSMSTLELRDTEKAKIACARKHFACISNGEIKYDVVDNYEALRNILIDY